MCPPCVDAEDLRESDWIANSEIGDPMSMLEWIGDGATTSSC